MLAGIVGLVSNNQAKAQLTVKRCSGNPSRIRPTKISRSGRSHQVIHEPRREGRVGRTHLAKNDKEKDPKLPPAEMMLAQCGSWPTRPPARGALEECVKNNPDDPEAYLVLADLAFSDRQVAAAELLFTKAEQLAANFKENAKRAMISVAAPKRPRRRRRKPRTMGTAENICRIG